ncbi:PRD domain-containing protein [uncultured Thomasclavelia sp.]|uniref:BglG family transcription antiterminator n=1 Tax=uncultured Thomasclavelia sp. TaxID=3025759 RepID=UPI0025CC5AC2|nr:PRD domain-containing protein [uncultured Thomasclavelia sp.]
MDLQVNNDEAFDQTKALITSIIKNTINDYDLTLSENSINNLAVHLAIAILRIKSNNYIPLSNSQISSYKQEYSYPYAKMLCDRLATEFNIEFPEAEISLVSMYLSKNQKLDLEINSGLDLLDEHVYQILRQSMDVINEKFQHDYRNDDRLIIAIGLHLEPALERLSKNEQVENPLKDKIIERHPTEFKYSQVLNEIIKQQLNLSFNDDELAFIALHFVVANNRLD